VWAARYGYFCGGRGMLLESVAGSGIGAKTAADLFLWGRAFELQVVAGWDGAAPTERGLFRVLEAAVVDARVLLSLPAAALILSIVYKAWGASQMPADTDRRTRAVVYRWPSIATLATVASSTEVLSAGSVTGTEARQTNTSASNSGPWVSHGCSNISPTVIRCAGWTASRTPQQMPAGVAECLWQCVGALQDCGVKFGDAMPGVW